MSERKSWDVVRKPAKAAEPAHPVATHAPTLSSGPRRNALAQQRGSRRPLREKRKEQRSIFRYVLIVFFLALISGVLYLIWLPALRVNTVEAQGLEQEGIKQVATPVLWGMYPYGIPHNSIFFLPESAIRVQVLKAFPDLSAISIKPTSLHGILITGTPRESAFVWCGVSVDAPPADGMCFNADSEGLIFSAVDPVTVNASSTLRIFAPLDRDIADGQSPIRAHVAGPQRMPDVLRFVKGLRALNAPVSSVAISGDEANLYLQGPTKIRYVLGHEDEAIQLAASALPTLNLTDGSIDYIDLRFIAATTTPGKVYVKRFGQ
jgi:hypothetical protein